MKRKKEETVINKLATLKEIEEKEKAEKERRDAQREQNQGLVRAPSLLYKEPGKVQVFQILHKWETHGELYGHEWLGKQWLNKLCEEHYQEGPCTICGTKVSFFSNRQKKMINATVRKEPIIFVVAKVFNLVGQTWSKKDETTGEVKQLEVKPVRVIRIPYGDGDANYNMLRNAGRLKFFDTELWTLSDYKVLDTLSEEDFHQHVSPQVKREILDSENIFMDKSMDDMMSIYLNTFVDIQWEKVGLKPPVMEKPNSESIVNSVA